MNIAMEQKQKVILVIDDDRIVHKLLSNMFTESGYAVKSLLDPTEALRTVQELMPDLIVLDLSMPHMSGFDVLKILFENDIHIPVIMLSATSQAHNIEYGLDLGARYFIPKPFEKGFLLSKVKELIG